MLLNKKKKHPFKEINIISISEYGLECCSLVQHYLCLCVILDHYHGLVG